MKVEVVVFFLLFLVVFSLMLQDMVPQRCLWVLLAVVGLNPYFWNLKDSVISDIPFLFGVYLTLFVIHWVYRSGHFKNRPVITALLVGLLVYFSYGIRSIGLVLIPSILLYEVLLYKKLSLFAVMATIISVLLIVLHNVFFHSDTDYLALLTFSPRIIFVNLFWYSKSFVDLWDNGYNRPLAYILFLSVSIFAFIGYLTRVKSSPALSEIFCFVYIPTILLFGGYQGIRYMLPVVPLYMYYAFIGIQNVPLRNGTRNMVFIVLLISISTSYIGKYAAVGFGPIVEGIGKRETIALFDYIRKKTDQKDIFVFQKPRALALYTNRSASVYHQVKEDTELLSYFKDIHATYVIVGRIFNDEDDDRHFLIPFVERHPEHFEEVYLNSDFTVYKIRENTPIDPNRSEDIPVP